MKKFLLYSAAVFISALLNAQTFNYTLSKSNATYSALSGATTVVSGSNLNSNGYKVPLGFSFTMQGKSYDTVTVASNGFLLFGNDNSRAVTTFKGIRMKNSSSISYLSSGGILKIQYSDVTFGSSNDNFNFQVWLNQNGNLVEFHTGSTNLNTAQDSLYTPLAGVLNPSMDKTTNGYLITGNPSSPQGESLGTGDLKYLIRVPDPNTVYILTPQ